MSASSLRALGPKPFQSGLPGRTEGRCAPLNCVADVEKGYANRELGVDGIVEGSLNRSAHGLHMTIQLIHAPSDTLVWANSYDRDLNDGASLPGLALAPHVIPRAMTTVSARPTP